MSTRSVRRATRAGTIILSMLAGALVVTWGGTAAMTPMTPEQLVVANCTTPTTAGGGVDPSCVEPSSAQKP